HRPSAPALCATLPPRCEGFAAATPEHLRAVMLSGAWIGRDRPARSRAFRPHGPLIARGGAPEAALWSKAGARPDGPAPWR
ncbi:hypothetical protein ACQWF6_25625, partial [Salmonella enterica subsp. enterica serovar Infantis]